MYKLHDFNQIPFYSKVQGLFIRHILNYTTNKQTLDLGIKRYLIEIMQLVHFTTIYKMSNNIPHIPLFFFFFLNGIQKNVNKKRIKNSNS